ncbi:protein kinase domain-containing protein [Capilliphycus salinus ALCB114379]|uniref:protein kinase domain-containing protein n=1 Tax=Capilliphycus salinus TaxID=2768948 RepID=UPI0039A5F251
MQVFTHTPPNPEKLLNNRYRILQSIGSGGFGETFLAEDTQMPSGRRCVIKQLKPSVNRPEIYSLIQEQFRREAAILEQLGEKSDRIPRLYAYFEEEEQFYLVQEWIEGETLTTRIQRLGRLSEAEVKEILLGILPILHRIHKQGLIHRDIKPDNIILRHPSGKPVLIDFGAVKETMGTMLNSQGNPTASILIGTPGFMASEQAVGYPLYSSDLYSLGMTAIYLLTGKTIKEMNIDRETGKILWHENVPNISRNFAAILDKAIQFYPRDRFSKAEEMYAALQTLPSPIPKTEPSLPPSTIIFPKPTASPKNKTSKLQFFHQLKDWQKATLVGVLTGAILGLGIAIPLKILFQQKSSEASTLAQQSNLPMSFYFIADSAFNDPEKAEQKRQDLIENGYSDAGLFWSPNYSNWSQHNSYKVYADWFETKSECEENLPEYRQFNPSAYCGFATK